MLVYAVVVVWWCDCILTVFEMLSCSVHCKVVFYSAILLCNLNLFLLWNIILIPSVLHVLSLSIVLQCFEISVTDLFESINTPISCITTTTDIDDVEWFNPYSLRDIAECSTLPYENIPPSGLLGDENSNYTHVSRNAEASCHLVAPFILNKHTHPFGIINPQNHCYMNSVIQSLFSIHRTISQNCQFNSSTEGSISKFLFEIACNASSSTDVDALKFRQYDKFYSGEQQEDASECLMMLIELINKGSVPYCGSNDNNSTGVSLSEIVFSFMLEKYIVCNACRLRSPHLSLVACYILHILIPLPCRSW